MRPQKAQEATGIALHTPCQRCTWPVCRFLGCLCSAPPTAVLISRDCADEKKRRAKREGQNAVSPESPRRKLGERPGEARAAAADSPLSGSPGEKGTRILLFLVSLGGFSFLPPPPAEAIFFPPSG